MVRGGPWGQGGAAAKWGLVAYELVPGQWVSFQG